MMNETQTKVWNILCDMSGEQVAQLWTNIYGTRVLDDNDVVNELIGLGYDELEEDDDEEEENENPECDGDEVEYSCTLDGLEVKRVSTYDEALNWLQAYDGDKDPDFEEVSSR